MPEDALKDAINTIFSQKPLSVQSSAPKSNQERRGSESDQGIELGKHKIYDDGSNLPGVRDRLFVFLFSHLSVF